MKKYIVKTFTTLILSIVFTCTIAYAELGDYLWFNEGAGFLSDYKPSYDSREKYGVLDICREFADQTIPKADMPSRGDLQEYKVPSAHCEDYTDVEVNQPYFSFSKYRKCLLSKDDTDYLSVAEIYANGWGVKRNAKLAMSLICRAYIVQAERKEMLLDLYRTRQDAKLKTSFDACDYAASGVGMYSCNVKHAVKDEKLRIIKRNKLTKTWNRPERAKLESLHGSAREYFLLHSTSDLDRTMATSWRAANAIDEINTSHGNFVKTLFDYEAGKFPTEDDIGDYELKLQKVYSETLSAPESFFKSLDLTNKNLMETQKAWLKYVDAWVSFANIRYPQLSTSVLKTSLLKNRIEDMKQIHELSQNKDYLEMVADDLKHG